MPSEWVPSPQSMTALSNWSTVRNSISPSRSVNLRPATSVSIRPPVRGTGRARLGMNHARELRHRAGRRHRRADRPAEDPDVHLVRPGVGVRVRPLDVILARGVGPDEPAGRFGAVAPVDHRVEALVHRLVGELPQFRGERRARGFRKCDVPLGGFGRGRRRGDHAGHVRRPRRLARPAARRQEPADLQRLDLREQAHVNLPVLARARRIESRLKTPRHGPCFLYPPEYPSCASDGRWTPERCGCLSSRVGDSPSLDRTHPDAKDGRPPNRWEPRSAAKFVRMTRTAASLAPTHLRIVPARKPARDLRAVGFDREPRPPPARGGDDAVPAGGGVGAVRELRPDGGAGGRGPPRARARRGRGLPRDRLGGAEAAGRGALRRGGDPLPGPDRRRDEVPAGRSPGPGRRRTSARCTGSTRSTAGGSGRWSSPSATTTGWGWKALADADVVLVGVSRTSKTPTSILLAQQGYRAANVSLAMGIAPPTQLLAMPRRKVIGLTMRPEQLGADPRAPPDRLADGAHHLQRRRLRRGRNWPGAASSSASRAGPCST